jgi:hypothetical protein
MRTFGQIRIITIMKIAKIIIPNFQQFKGFELDLTYPEGHAKGPGSRWRKSASLAGMGRENQLC